MRVSRNLTSKQFGLLIALYREVDAGRSKWVCHCRCGKQVKVRQEDLISGRSKSCGCAREQLKSAKAEKKYSLVNHKFGRLLVLWKSKSKTSRSMIWECRCDCGRVLLVTGTHLRNGKMKSCGCIQRDLTKILDRFVNGVIGFEDFVALCGQVVNPLKRKENATS